MTEKQLIERLEKAEIDLRMGGKRVFRVCYGEFLDGKLRYREQPSGRLIPEAEIRALPPEDVITIRSRKEKFRTMFNGIR